MSIKIPSLLLQKLNQIGWNVFSVIHMSILIRVCVLDKYKIKTDKLSNKNVRYVYVRTVTVS